MFAYPPTVEYNNLTTSKKLNQIRHGINILTPTHLGR